MPWPWITRTCGSPATDAESIRCRTVARASSARQPRTSISSDAGTASGAGTGDAGSGAGAAAAAPSMTSRARGRRMRAEPP